MIPPYYMLILLFYHSFQPLPITGKARKNRPGLHILTDLADSYLFEEALRIPFEDGEGLITDIMLHLTGVLGRVFSETPSAIRTWEMT